jgi:hypothetical protein
MPRSTKSAPRDAFDGAAAYSGKRRPGDVDVRRRATGGRSVLVSGDFFETLGLSPVIGRLLTPRDDRRRGDRVAIQRRCGASASVAR